MSDTLDLSFETRAEPEGGFSARCLQYSIFTQGDTWAELRENITQAAQAFVFDRPGVRLIIKIIEVREEFTLPT
jgi:predicted RNase H-like HicB family nuclease